MSFSLRIMAMSFYLLLILFVSVALTSPTSIQDEIDRLSQIDQEKIMYILLSASARNALVDNTESWCCKIDPGIEAFSKTRLTTYTIMQHGRHRCGYHSCGFAGWSRCTRWCSETWTSVESKVETYVVYQARICPKDQLVCCAQHIYVMGHCFSYTEILHNQQLLSELNALGIVIPGPSVG